MNRLNELNLDFLKRPRILISIAVVIVALIVWYFAWWSPESNKLASVKAQQTTERSTILSLDAKLAQVIRESQIVKKYSTFLATYADAVPVLPEQGQLVQEIGQLKKADGVDISSLDCSTTVAAATGSTLSTIPITLSLTGTRAQVIKFLTDLYSMKRLVTIQEVSPSPTGGSGAGSSVNVLVKSNMAWSLSVQATAYFSGQITPPPA